MGGSTATSQPPARRWPRSARHRRAQRSGGACAASDGARCNSIRRVPRCSTQPPPPALLCTATRGASRPTGARTRRVYSLTCRAVRARSPSISKSTAARPSADPARMCEARRQGPEVPAARRPRCAGVPARSRTRPRPALRAWGSGGTDKLQFGGSSALAKRQQTAEEKVMSGIEDSRRLDMPAGSAPLAGHQVARIGFGAMQLPGPHVWGPPPDRDMALAVLRRAVELGVNHIDTAHYYGARVSNELIHAALHPYPEDLVLVS